MAEAIKDGKTPYDLLIAGGGKRAAKGRTGSLICTDGEGAPLPNGRAGLSCIEPLPP